MAKKLDNPVTSLYNNILDESEKKYDIDSGDIAYDRQSTGILVLDLILGGGTTSGMFLVAGPSQSAKSTIAFTILANAVKQGVPVNMLRDAEGSAAGDRIYVANIFHGTVEKVFGKKIDGKWVIPPLFRYSRNNLLRTFFDDIVHVLNRLPDKIYIAERKRWFLKVDTKNPKVAPWAGKLGTADPKLSDKRYKYFPSDPGYQAIIIPDSYPAFVPEGVDEAEEASDRRALLAAEYSLNLPRIVGKLGRKHVLWWGVNQLRKNPGKTMGSPDYLPCGEALQFNAIAMLQSKAEWVPDKWKNKGNKYKETAYTISYEPSIEGKGEDGYSYKRILLSKNKLGIMADRAYLRVWTSDHTGRGRGIDPVYDALQFMEMLKIAKMKNGKGGKIVVFSKDTKWPFAGKTLEWLDFKAVILAEDTDNAETKQKAAKVYKKLKIDKPCYIRKFCTELNSSGQSIAMRMAVKSDRSDADEKDLEE